MTFNNYDSLDDFIGEYSGICTKKHERFYGLDFTFHGKLYRMTIDQMEPNDIREKFEKMLNKKLGKYEVALVDPKGSSELQYHEYQFIGWYFDIYDLLENCYIDGMKFKDVIMDRNTILEGQD